MISHLLILQYDKKKLKTTFSLKIQSNISLKFEKNRRLKEKKKIY